MNPPDNLPPLPPGSRYAGKLKDHTGALNGWVITDFGTGWTYGPWEGRADRPNHYSAVWHVALPIEVCPTCRSSANMVDGVCHSTHPVDHPDVRPMGAVTICRNGYVEDLERRLRDTEKLLAQYSAEREHNAMLALGYKAERDLLFKRLQDLYDYTASCEHGEPGWPREAPALARDTLKTPLTP